MIRMYLKNGRDVITIAPNPASINVKTPSRVYQNLSIVDKGEIQRIMKEKTLKEVSFSSFFSKENEGIVLNGEGFWPAQDMAHKVEKWRSIYSPIRFVVTGSWELNICCTITEFSYDVKGLGDAWYNINLKEFQPTEIRTLLRTGETFTTNKGDVLSTKHDTSYTVKKGDNLTQIAQTLLGSGHRWREIWELNKSLISNPDLIFPGQILKIPAK